MKQILTLMALVLITINAWANCTDKGGNSQQIFAACLQAAQQGDATAQLSVGNMYFKGEHTIQDYQEALRWYRQAGEQGNANALYNIGVFHDKGLAVEKDFNQAAKWYQQAADLGFPDALYNLGVMHEYGQAVAQDYTKAREYYLQAAEKGEPSAQFSLGLLYDKGLGVEKDYVTAYMGWAITGDGHKNAEFNRDSLAEDMTPMQISEAKRLAKAWQAARPNLQQLPPQVFPPGFE